MNVQIERNEYGNPSSVSVDGEVLKEQPKRTNRHIFMNDRYVVKIDGSIPQAQDEAATWLTIEPEDRQYFAALLHVRTHDVLKRQRAEQAARRSHRSLARYDRLMRDLEKTEALIRKQHTFKRYDEPKRSIKHLLRRRNRIVEMMNAENRKSA